MNEQENVNFMEHFISHLFLSVVSTWCNKSKFPISLPLVTQVASVLEVDWQPCCFGRDLFNQDVEHKVFKDRVFLLRLSDCINVFPPWALVLQVQYPHKEIGRIHSTALCSNAQPLTQISERIQKFMNFFRFMSI